MGCFTFVKVMMIMFNFLIFMGGLVLLAMGIWATVDGGTFLQIVGSFSTEAMHFINVGFLSIAIGVLLTLLGLLGLFAAHRESKCLLLMYFSIILMIFIAEVAAGVVALAYSALADGIIQAWATPALKEHYGSDPVVTNMWNTTMMELKCCGFSNYTDFVDSHYAEHNDGNLPIDCCLRNSTVCSPREAERDNIEGCYEEILEMLRMNGNIVGGVATGIGVLQIGAMVVSIYIYCYLDNREPVLKH